MEPTFKKYHDWGLYIKVNICAFYISASGLDSLLQKLADFQLQFKIPADFVSLPIEKESLAMTKPLSGVHRPRALLSVLVL